MRIFSAVRHSNDPSRFYGGLWSANFYPALKRLGHILIESKTDLTPCSRFMEVPQDFTSEEISVRGRITEQILDEIRIALKSGPIDLFLAYFYNSHFDPAGFNELRRLGIPSVNFYCNSIYQFPLVAAIAKEVDYSWHPERDARQLYLSAGARPVWVQMGADPEVYRPVPELARKPRACFIGQCYADRDQLAAAVLSAGLPLDLYGANWGKQGSADGIDPTASTVLQSPKANYYLGRSQNEPGSWKSYLRAGFKILSTDGPVSGTIRLLKRRQALRAATSLKPLLSSAALGRATDVAATFSQYQLALNFSNVWSDGLPGSQLISHVRLRDFEAPMSGACYLTGYSDEIAVFYKLGTEIDTYNSTEELVDKTRFYLANSSAADQMRLAGRQRAIRDHTWDRRFQSLFDQIHIGR